MVDNPVLRAVSELVQRNWCVVDWNGYLPNKKAFIQKTGKTFYEYFGISVEAMQSGGFVDGGIYTLVVPYDDKRGYKYCVLFFLPEGVGIALAGDPSNYASMDTPKQVIDRCRELLSRGDIDTSTSEFQAAFSPDLSLRRLIERTAR